MASNKENKPKSGEKIFTVLMLIFVIGYLYVSFTYAPEARRSPVIIGSLLIFLFIIQVLKIIKIKAESTDAGSAKKDKRLIKLMIYLVSTVILAYLIGLIPALAIFMIIFFVLIVNKSILLSLGLGAVTWVALYLLFVKILVLPMWDGVIIEAIF